MILLIKIADIYDIYFLKMYAYTIKITTYIFLHLLFMITHIVILF